MKTSGNKSGAKLTWVDNSSDETGFKVYSSRNGGAWTLVTTTAANVTTFTTGTLASGTWQFYVAAVNGLYESDPSIGVSLLI